MARIYLSIFFAALCLPALAAQPFSAAGHEQEEREIIRLANQQRIEHGLEPLQRNPLLTEAARDHSENMARQNLLAHELNGHGPAYRVKNTGYEYFAVGENIAFNNPTPAAAMQSWMSSPGHRANILNKNYTETGVGIALNELGRPYYTQVFGRPRSAGATTHATFTIRNESGQPVRIQMEGHPARSQLLPGASGRFSISGMGQLPKMRIAGAAGQTELQPKDGAVYVIGEDQNGLLVRGAQAFR